MSAQVILDYGNGIQITRADNAGGKAGRGYNKTSTIQIRINEGGIVQMVKHFQYTIGDTDGKSFKRALQKAENYVKNNLLNNNERI